MDIVREEDTFCAFYEMAQSLLLNAVVVVDIYLES